jgi:hypothetical protein
MEVRHEIRTGKGGTNLRAAGLVRRLFYAAVQDDVLMWN